VNCPKCGAKAVLVGQPAGLYGASFRCYRCSVYGFPFESKTAEALEEAARAAATSRANAEAYRKPKP